MTGAVACDRAPGTDASLVNGHFRFISSLGAGGMGSVYMARYLGGCLVAVKLVKQAPDNPNARELEERFERECRILMGLRHPSIVTAYTHGRIRGTSQRFLVMEHVRGHTLAAHRRQLGRPLTPSEATRLLLPLADALAYCHTHRIYHRDLSPKNVLVVEGPNDTFHVKLVDFGASWRDEEQKLTKGVIFGNIDFQPLERFQRETQSLDPTVVGFEVDLFGLAAIGYYLTGGTGERGALLDIHQKVGSEPITVDGEPEWSALLERAIARDRRAHFPDMLAFARALRSFHPDPHERETTEEASFWFEPTERARPEAAPVVEVPPSSPHSWLERIDRLPRPVHRAALGLLVLAAFGAGWWLG